MPYHQPDEDLALLVNVRARWPEIKRGYATPEDVILGDWKLADRDIDPATVRVVCGV
jgi:hypothetical protein